MVWVIGLGHPGMSDDAAGLKVVRELSRNPWPGEVEFVEAAALAPDVLPPVTGLLHDEPLHIIVADAVSMGMPPGTVVRVALDDTGDGIRGENALSLHTLGLEAMLAPLRIMGINPDSITLVGIEAASVRAGCEMTELLNNRWESFVRALVDEINLRSGIFR